MKQTREAGRKSDY